MANRTRGEMTRTREAAMVTPVCQRNTPGTTRRSREKKAMRDPKSPRMAHQRESMMRGNMAMQTRVTVASRERPRSSRKDIATCRRGG
jgi:hypothetical protein